MTYSFGFDLTFRYCFLVWLVQTFGFNPHPPAKPIFFNVNPLISGHAYHFESKVLDL